MAKPTIEELQQANKDIKNRIAELEANKTEAATAKEELEQKLTEAIAEKVKAETEAATAKEDIAAKDLKIAELEAVALNNAANPKNPVETSTLMASSTIISASSIPTNLNDGLVAIKVQYPDGYSGYKAFKDGEVKMVGVDAAKTLVNKGIASYVEQ